MYQALYRKWRPRSFSDVVGQAHITETLQAQIVSGRLSHAYLFVGTRGTGKTTCAKILARAANCEHPVDGNPCNVCASCVGIENGAILDVEELDAASNNGVDNIRSLRDEAIFTPASVRKRVYIVDEVHMLSTSAFNALLKILEEPPEHLIFILATTEAHKVPATILSRCQRFSFKRITAGDIAERISYVAAQEGINLTPDAAELLSRLADGALRDALSLLDQCSGAETVDYAQVVSAIGLAGTQEIAHLFELISAQNTAGALELLARFYADGKDLKGVLDELMSLVRDVLMSAIAPNTDALMSGNFSSEMLAGFRRLMPKSRALSALHILQDSLSEIPNSADIKTLAELCIIKLCDESLSGDLSAVLSRISALEDRVKSGVAPVPQSTAAVSQITEPIERVDAPPFETADDPDLPPFEIEEAPVSAEPEFVPEPEPAATVTETPAPAAPAADSDAQWEQILLTARNEIDPPVYAFMSDSAHAVAEISGDTLVIRAKNTIASNMIDTAPVLAAVRSAAEKVLGRSVMVRVADYNSSSSLNTDKLDALSKFDNIKFM